MHLLLAILSIYQMDMMSGTNIAGQVYSICSISYKYMYVWERISVHIKPYFDLLWLIQNTATARRQQWNKLCKATCSMESKMITYLVPRGHP